MTLSFVVYLRFKDTDDFDYEGIFFQYMLHIFLKNVFS